jgi:hypothetical protein
MKRETTIDLGAVDADLVADLQRELEGEKTDGQLRPIDAFCASGKHTPPPPP